MSSHLVISAIGDDQRGIVEKIASVINDNGCNIENSRMSVLGGAFAQILLVSGKWNNLAKLESSLNTLAKQLDLMIGTRRTEPRKASASFLPYSVEIVALDHPGILNQLAHFFTTRGINIQDMVTGTYHAAHTATPMGSISLSIELPADVHIASLREEFLDLCDANNLDGVIEPLKL